MHGRWLKASFFEDRELVDLERSTGQPVRLAYQGLWCAADRTGVFQWDAEVLKQKIFRFEPEVDFDLILQVLSQHRYIAPFLGYRTRHDNGHPIEHPTEQADRLLGLILNFHLHQIVRSDEAQTFYSDPPESLRIERARFKEAKEKEKLEALLRMKDERSLPRTELDADPPPTVEEKQGEEKKVKEKRCDVRIAPEALSRATPADAEDCTSADELELLWKTASRTVTKSWLDSLKSNPEYRHRDIDREYQMCLVYWEHCDLEARLSRKGFLRFLNRERSMDDENDEDDGRWLIDD